MKVALVTANEEKQGFNPLGVLYLASYCRKYVKYDSEYCIFDFMPSIEELLEGKYDVIAFSCLTIHYPKLSELASRLRCDYGGVIVVGGIHISLLGILPKWADIACIGEGEKTFKEVIECLYENNLKVTNYLNRIKGIKFRNSEGQVVFTGYRDFIKDLDEIPIPARDLIDMNDYLKPNNVFGTKVGRGLGMMTSRGCSFNCDFCSNSKVWGQPRYHSPQYIVEEIKTLIEMYRIDSIYFQDDNFCGNRERLINLAYEIEKNNIHIEFGASGRIEFIDDAMIEIFNRIGVKAISFGIETGSNRMLTKIKDRQRLTVEEEVERVLKVIDSGIEVHGLFMLNMPGETWNDMTLTKKMIEEIPFAKCSISLASPYYGTKWWDIAVEQGIVPKIPTENYWELYDMHNYGGARRPLFKNEVASEKVVELYEEMLKIAHERWNFDWRNRVVLSDKNPK